MEYQIISNITSKQQLVIEDDMKVGEVRGVIAAMLDVPEDVVMTITYNGKLLSQDEEEWGALISSIDATLTSAPPVRKLFCSVTSRPKLEDMSTDAIRAVLGSKESKIAEEQRERQQAKAMEPLIENMANNPEFVKSLMSADPGMKEMWKKNPQMKKEMSNPETLKMLMMSQIDPDRRRDIGRSLDLQLAQFAAIPGAQQMMERQLASILRDEENVTHSTTDLHAASEEHARPDPQKDANNEALPNPWQASHSQAAMPPIMPWLSKMPQIPGSSPFAMFNQTRSASPYNNFNVAFPHTTNSTAINPFAHQQHAHLPQLSSAIMSNNKIVNLVVPASTTETTANTNKTAITNTANNNANVNENNKYEEQIKLLKEMGFANGDAVMLRVLNETSGDVEAAVTLLAEQECNDNNNNNNNSSSNNSDKHCSNN